MQRLLADASKLSGKKYDISNLSDVYEAIHVIQQEIGITGTTAKEAEQTIEGSTKSLQGAWQNLLVAFGQDNADLGKQIDELVNGVMIFARNTIPRLTNIVTNIVTTLIRQLPQILTIGVEIVQQIIEGVFKMIPKLITALADLLVQLPELIETSVAFIGKGQDMVLELVNGILEAIPKLLDVLPEVIVSIIDVITENLPKLVEMGIKLVIKLAYGIIKAIPQLVSKIPQIITAIVKGLKQGFTNLYQAGKDLIKGLWQGIKDMTSWIKSKISGFGKDILDTLKDFFGIHSPSRVMRDQIGKNIAKGIAEGIKAETKSVTGAMKNLANSTLSVAKSTFTKSGFETVAEKLSTKMEKSIDSYTTKSINSITKLVNNQVTKASKNLDKTGKAQMKKVGTATIKAYTEAIKDYSKQAKELISSTLDGIADEYEEKYNELVKKQQNLQSKFSDYGDLFTRDEDGNMVLNDIAEQTNAITNYFDHLQTIKGKISSDLFDVISEMSIEDGNEFVTQLLNMTKAEVKVYDENYTKKLNLSKSMSKKIYKSDLEAINNDYNNAIDEALKGLNKKMQNLGTQAMKGFISGMKDEKKNLTKTGDALVDALTKALKKKLGIKSPSKVYKEEIGKNLALGIGEGFSDTMSIVNGEMQNAIPTEFDTSSANINSNGFSYNNMVSAFKDALKEMKVELDDREVGSFVTRTVERQVFA